MHIANLYLQRMEKYDIVFIGGGFYSCYLALMLADSNKKILIVEKEDDLLKRASFVNQARVHNGYHYPRSFMTALRSRMNYKKFVSDFRDAVTDDFTKLYAIARQSSKVTSRQFVKFCNDIGASVELANPVHAELFNDQCIEDVFTVEESAFNASILKDMFISQLAKSSVDVLYGTEVKYVRDGSACLEVVLEDDTLLSDYVINCTYSQINSFLHSSNLPLLPLRHEITEIALVDVPDEIKDLGITVMDGPFFSVMPFPAKKMHSMSHVRYTPHYSWSDTDSYRDPHAFFKQHKLVSSFQFMQKDIARYIPILDSAKHTESIYEVKTVLVDNESDDGRPILFREHYGMQNLFLIMGGKIDNIYDVAGELKKSIDA